MNINSYDIKVSLGIDGQVELMGLAEVKEVKTRGIQLAIRSEKLQISFLSVRKRFFKADLICLYKDEPADGTGDVVETVLYNVDQHVLRLQEPAVHRGQVDGETPGAPGGAVRPVLLVHPAHPASYWTYNQE